MKYDPQALGNIPAELVNLPRWVVWKLLPNNEPGKPPKKFPFDPKNGRTAKPGQPETWGTFAQALEALQAGDYTGLGLNWQGMGLWALTWIMSLTRPPARWERKPGRSWTGWTATPK